jgi:hypothetical protein
MNPTQKSDLKKHLSRRIRKHIFPVQAASQPDEAGSERDESNGEIVSPIRSDLRLDRKLPSARADITSIPIEVSCSVLAPAMCLS